MPRVTMIAAALLAAAPAAAKTNPGTETAIPRFSYFLEWQPDGARALFIRGDTGRWYHVRMETDCPRLRTQANIRFLASPGNRFDRRSAINADGWRCLVSSVVESDAPAARGRRTIHGFNDGIGGDWRGGLP